MTDRYAALIVTLAEDVREDDAQQIITALRMVRGVIDVSPVVADSSTWVAQRRADQEWRERIIDPLDRGQNL